MLTFAVYYLYIVYYYFPYRYVYDVMSLLRKTTETIIEILMDGNVYNRIFIVFNENYIRLSGLLLVMCWSLLLEYYQNKVLKHTT